MREDGRCEESTNKHPIRSTLDRVESREKRVEKETRDSSRNRREEGSGFRGSAERRGQYGVDRRRHRREKTCKR